MAKHVRHRLERLLRTMLEGAGSSIVPEPAIRRLQNVIDQPRLDPWPGEPHLRGFLSGATGAALRQTTPLDLALAAMPGARAAGHPLLATARRALRPPQRRLPHVADVDPVLLETLDARITGLMPNISAPRRATDAFKEEQFRRGIRRLMGE